MKKIYKGISYLSVVIVTILSVKETKAAKTRDISNRVNKIRVALKESIKEGKTVELSEKEFLTKDLSNWVNWGNWGNWNNWNNWRDWNNWGNWGNWGNY